MTKNYQLNFFQEKNYRIDNFFDRIVDEIVKEEKTKTKFSLELALVSDKTIQKLNAKYRSKNTPTDVLSFRNKETVLDQPWPEEDNDLGQVFISVETAIKQAQEKGHSLNQELAWLSIHGILHLLDYDHERSSQEAKTMENKTAS
ncbi:rRNA maturation RNase YbeY, partial [Patescibacteria group bacterium]|nr:rRNA maturation RNase YbeY [Patescibacteria group bacterium]